MDQSTEEQGRKRGRGREDEEEVEKKKGGFLKGPPLTTGSRWGLD